MDRTLIGSFANRRDAELAVEHLVQQHGIERADIFIQPQGASNSAGIEAAGADIESGHPGQRADGDPKLAGPIEVSVDCDAAKGEEVKAAFRQAGVRQLRTH